MNALGIRQQILFACGEGDDTDTSLLYDSGHVQRLFLRSIETGLQDESIRAKIRPFLKDPNVTDEVLIQQMSMASSAEKERDKKLTNNISKPPTVSVSSVSDGSPKDKQESKKRNSQSDILAAITAIKSDVEALKEEIRRQSSNQSVPHTKGPERKGPDCPPMCSNCLRNKKDYCNHCFKCGSDSILQGDAENS